MKDDLLALRDRIEAELNSIERTASLAKDAWRCAENFPDQKEHYYNSVALNLHSFYNGFERIFEMIARLIDKVFPSGDQWHRDLLRQMTLEIPEIRPKVISLETYKLLDDFLSFRHRVRNLYAFDLKSEKLLELLNYLPEALSHVRLDLEKFSMLLSIAVSKDND